MACWPTMAHDVSMFRPPVDRPPPDIRDDEEKAYVARILAALAEDHPPGQLTSAVPTRLRWRIWSATWNSLERLPKLPGGMESAAPSIPPFQMTSS